MTLRDNNSHARAQEFFITEYKALRDEINNRLAELASLERYFLISTAAIYVWLSAVQFGVVAAPGEGPVSNALSASQQTVLKAMWFVPFALSLLCGLRAAGSGTRIAQIGEYIRVIEEGWRSGDLEKALGYRTSNQAYWGWEGFMPPKHTGLVLASMTFWFASVFVTLVLALVVAWFT